MPLNSAAVTNKWRHNSHGAVAQLGERLVRNEEAVGSIPISSTRIEKLQETVVGSPPKDEAWRTGPPKGEARRTGIPINSTINIVLRRSLFDIRDSLRILNHQTRNFEY